jgi:hypothetical protein
MQMVLAAILYIGCPMAVAQLLYRIIDRGGEKTAKLVERFPVIKRRKFILQIVVPILFLIVMGIIAVLCSMPVKVFFIICGVFVGVVNGMAVTMMYND